MLGTKGFTKGLAKAQLRSFLSFRSKYPDMKAEELYLQALKMRPGYSEDEILGLLSDAKRISYEEGIDFNFQIVVFRLAVYEFWRRTKYDPSQKEMLKIEETVKQTIPANL